MPKFGTPRSPISSLQHNVLQDCGLNVSRLCMLASLNIYFLNRHWGLCWQNNFYHDRAQLRNSIYWNNGVNK